MEDFYKRALDYHAKPIPGKIGTYITKKAVTVTDLSLAYSPGVAAPVEEIARDKRLAYKYTNKSNTVAVISNGTAVLGLGNMGSLASKPVMEGKALLYKLFANIDALDIVVDTTDPDDFINVVHKISDTFGGINLEDVKAPECFYIEKELQKRCNIPIFHDDQHGTAIVVAAGLLNALELQGKTIGNIKLLCLGAGASGIATLNLLIELGLKRENIFLFDSRGLIHKGREDLSQYKSAFAQDEKEGSIGDFIAGCDVFLGLSKGNILSKKDIMHMAPKPILFTLANPDPEILPELAMEAVKDVIIATGRSDYPNQVNNVIAFPFIFRGTLDAHASSINLQMKIAAVHAIRELARDEKIPLEVCKIYGNKDMVFGPKYIIPTPFDPRLNEYISPKVKEAAIKSGVGIDSGKSNS